MWVHFSLSRTPWAAFSGKQAGDGICETGLDCNDCAAGSSDGAPSSRGQDKRGTAILEKDGESAVTNGNYYALVIGIDEYPSPLPSLSRAVADARAVSSLLKPGLWLSSAVAVEPRRDPRPYPGRDYSVPQHAQSQ